MLGRVRRWRLVACVVIAWLASASSAPAVGLFATDESPGAVSPFSIQADGTLAPVACTPASNCQVEAGTFLFGIAVDPFGGYLYAAGEITGNLGSVPGFSIGPGDLLAPIACTPAGSCQTGSNTSPFAIAVDPSGRYVYTTDDNGPGSVSGFAIGAAGALSPIACTPASNCNTGFYPLGIAIDPSGRYLYTADENSNEVSVFSIGVGGALAPVACGSGCSVPVSSGNSPYGMAADPTGRYVYVTNFTRGTPSKPGIVQVFSIGSGGVLSPVACSTSCETGNGSYPDAVAVDPSGHYVYTADSGTNAVSAFSIGAGGALTPIPCTPAANCQTPSGSGPDALAIDPSGKFLYVSGGSSTISVFSIGSDGALTPIVCSPSSNCQMAAGSRGIVVAPDRGPTASLHVSAGSVGLLSTLDASASSSPDYPIASYAWSFGDGQSAVTNSPSVQHRYATVGLYTATVTATDQAGCSTSEVYDGQSAYCDGSSKASATSTMSVSSRPVLCRCVVQRVGPRLTNVAQSHRRWREGTHLARFARKRKPPVGTTFTFTLNEQATVSFSFSRSVSGGRKVAHKCVAKSRANSKRKACRRTIAAGTLTFTGHQGVDRVVFDGRVSKTRKLTPGTYTLTIIATNAARLRSAPVKLTFTIVK